MTKKYGLSEEALKKTFMGIVKPLDDSRKHGRTVVSESVDSIELRVLHPARK
jgi:hypothetical protein